MITLRMTSDDIRSAFDKDVYEKEEFDRFFDKTKKEFAKLKKNAVKSDSYARCYPYISKESNQKYVLVWSWCDMWGSKGFHSLIFAEVDGGERGRLYIARDKRKGAMISAFSVHYLNRHNERMGYKETTTMQKLARYVVSGHYYSNFWSESNKEKRYLRNVAACHEGLALCDYDTELGHQYYRTFVSFDMLKKTQREAFDIIIRSGLLKEREEVYKRFKRSYNAGLEAMEAFEIMESDRRSIANEIYNQYFE